MPYVIRCPRPVAPLAANLHLNRHAIHYFDSCIRGIVLMLLLTIEGIMYSPVLIVLFYIRRPPQGPLTLHSAVMQVIYLLRSRVAGVFQLCIQYTCVQGIQKSWHTAFLKRVISTTANYQSKTFAFCLNASSD